LVPAAVLVPVVLVPAGVLVQLWAVRQCWCMW
jgi:hypothetical protein